MWGVLPRRLPRHDYHDDRIMIIIMIFAIPTDGWLGLKCIILFLLFISSAFSVGSGSGATSRGGYVRIV
jgi:hypothetical protein